MVFSMSIIFLPVIMTIFCCVVVVMSFICMVMVISLCVMSIVVTMSASVVMVVMMSMVSVMSRCKKSLFGVVPSHVRENSIFDVASQKSFLAEGSSVLLGVDSPTHVSAEK